MIKSRNFIATPPGRTIKEQLLDRGWTRKSLLLVWKCQKHISKLINGDVQAYPDVAMRLEMVLGLPAHFWITLNRIYREKVIQVEAENQMDEDKDLIKSFPYKEMSKNNWVAVTTKPGSSF